MTEQDENNLNHAEDPDPIEDIHSLETSSKTTPPVYKQSGMIAAIVMIVLALVLFLVWFIQSRKTAAVEPEPSEEVQITLGNPQVIHDFEESPTLAPMQTDEAVLATPTATPEPRSEVITHVIQEGETVSSIASLYGLWPETILWANRYELEDDIRNYIPGMTIYILPVDGTYHVWSAGEGLGAVSKYYGVMPEDIINFPGNKLDAATIGSYAAPNIKPGTRLVVPGGTMPNYFASDTLLYYAALEKINSLPLGTAESYPAPRSEIIAYEVVEKDTIFTVAEKFDLEPQTILWTNRYLIGDTPDGIYPGQKLIILPEDGVYHAWLYGEGLNSVSRIYGVTPEDILNEPLNKVDVSKIGEYSLPKIKTGTFLYVPGGKGSIPTWVGAITDPSDPAGKHPNVSYLGAFACNTTAWAVGSGAFQLPNLTPEISGYEFNPPVHNGLDYAGRTGDSIFATDTGVVIYAGWSDRGYGNTIVIDHGNGYLSLYAHLMDGGINVGCGNIVSGGQTIGFMGSTGMSTGSHLHFELRYNGSPVNPHGFGL